MRVDKREFHPRFRPHFIVNWDPWVVKTISLKSVWRGQEASSTDNLHGSKPVELKGVTHSGGVDFQIGWRGMNPSVE